MYLDRKDVKALKVVLEQNTRIRGRRSRAVSQLQHLINENDKRIRQQRKEIKRMTSISTKLKDNNSMW